jgi:hypothetical protein
MTPSRADAARRHRSIGFDRLSPRGRSGAPSLSSWRYGVGLPSRRSGGTWLLLHSPLPAARPRPSRGDVLRGRVRVAPRPTRACARPPRRRLRRLGVHRRRRRPGRVALAYVIEFVGGLALTLAVVRPLGAALGELRSRDAGRTRPRGGRLRGDARGAQPVVGWPPGLEDWGAEGCARVANLVGLCRRDAARRCCTSSTVIGRDRASPPRPTAAGWPVRSSRQPAWRSLGCGRAGGRAGGGLRRVGRRCPRGPGEVAALDDRRAGIASPWAGRFATPGSRSGGDRRGDGLSRSGLRP